MKYYYIVAAAGVGKRMQLDYPKQFLEYNGKPIFIKTLETISKNRLVTDIIIVTNKDYIEKVKEYVKDFNIEKVKDIIQGGKERQDSVYNALEIINDEDAIVAVQDGVRPFIKEEYIEKAYKELEKNMDISGVVIGVMVKDTIKVVDENGIIIQTPNRSSLVAAQTPQVFRLQTLKKAYKKAKEEGYLGTDDSSLVEIIGEKVKILEGDYDNIKITTKEDLIYLEK
ncbi:MAG: 2-C-methyl-D-erythritol 4-phosphate cytidylyltransferase [Fusobacteriaceae bacterium]|jgi:2-C-methyl-D-erythritol 4-phosphate cytidylyltransferase|nr:2-C-methyl-D-erythritol 4-phosphate cytidylyltransferase [Fusobacteriales bacterium]MDN5304852.1 2-C-methyl-D-erythritol 4-phosphate cytidylyltransferase [Fusobacteriaceae bacterium]